MLGRSLGLAPFNNPALEAGFAAHQAAHQAYHDRLTGAIGLCLFCLACARFRHAAPPWCPATVLAVVGACTVAWLWPALLGPASYRRHRLWVVAGKQKACCCALAAPGSPASSGTGSASPHAAAKAFSAAPPRRPAAAAGLRLYSALVPGVPGEAMPLQFPDTLLGRLGALTIALKLPKLWITALGSRLPFKLHVALHALVFTLCLRTLPTSCASPLLHQPVSTQFFSRTADLLGGLAQAGALMVPPAAWNSSSSGGGGAGHVERQERCHCVQVLGASMCLLGFVLPTLVVGLLELAARAAWAASRRPAAAAAYPAVGEFGGPGSLCSACFRCC